MTRDRQPWEVSAGALCLLREIAPQVPEAAAAQLPQLASLCRLDSFAHHHQLWPSGQVAKLRQEVGIAWRLIEPVTKRILALKELAGLIPVGVRIDQRMGCVVGLGER